MNNPNPFVPKGSLLEQQSARRSRLKLAVFCVLAVSVTGLVAMLIQGCKREKPSDTDLNPPSLDTNAPAMDTNLPPMSVSNPPVVVPPVATNPPVVIPPVAPVEPVAAAGSEYVVVKGDSLAKIAKKSGVTLKALQAANPGVVPTKLKVGQKLAIPAGGKSADATAPSVAAGGDAGGASYTVKSGDTLTKIAKKNGVTLKALEAANPGVVPTKLKVGQKLTVPAGGSAATGSAASSVAAVGDTGGATYTVKSGDTLTKIAKKNGTTAKAIQAANGLTTTKIKVGQKLKIPSKAEAAAPAAPAPVADTTPAPALPPISVPAPAAPAPAK